MNENHVKDSLTEVQQWAEQWTLEMFPEYYDYPDHLRRDIIVARLVEEMGEAAKAMRQFHGRKYKGVEEKSLEHVQEELSDTLILLFKLYTLFGLSVWDGIEYVVEKLEKRKEDAKNESDTNIQSSCGDV